MTDTPAEDIVVEVTSEAPAAATPDTGTPVSDAPEIGIEDLKRQLAEKDAGIKAQTERADREAAARVEAERRAQSASGEAHQFRNAKEQAEFDSIVNALGAAEGEAKQLQAEATAALEAGEFAKANEIQLKIGRLGARIERLEEGKQVLEARRSATPERQPRAPQPLDWGRAWNSDETESFLSSRTPPTAAWIRQHPQFANDPSFRSKVSGADGYVANVLGIQRDTPEYFAKIEETVGLRRPQEGQHAMTTTASAPAPAPSTAAAVPAAPTSAAAVATPRAPTPAAPPTPSVPSSRPGASGTRITLTPEEAAHARATLTKDIIGDKDPLVVYAQNKQQLIAEGKWFGPNGQR